MNYEDSRINEALWDSNDEGIIVMHGWRDYGVWMRCTNYQGEWVAPTCFGDGYKSRYAAQRAFAACGGQTLCTRSVVFLDGYGD